MDKKILVASADFKKAYPIIKSVARAGYKPIVVFHNIWSWPKFSRYVRKRYKVANPYKNERKYAIQVAHVAHKENVAMIIPVGFIDNVVLAKYRRFLKDFILPIPSYENIKNVSDKSKLGRMATKIGIKYPQTVSISSFNEVKTDFSLPLVVKGASDASVPSYLFDKRQLLSTLKSTSLTDKQTQILQQFISGWGHGYFALAKDGNAYLEFSHKRIIEEQPSGGPSIVACAYHDPELTRIGRRIVKELNWSGVLMAEFKKDFETGEYYLIEINPKFWGSLELSIACGADFVKHLIEIFLEKKTPPAREYIKRNCCFSWILAGSKYITENYKIWARIVYYGVKHGIFSTDIHIADPPELLLSSIFATLRAFIYRKKINKRKKELIEAAKSNFINNLRNIKITGIFFDLDGTLADIPVQWGKLKESLVKKGPMSQSDSILTALYKAKTTNTDTFKKISTYLERYELEAIKRIKPNQELYSLLEILKKNNLKLAVVSKQSRKVIEATLKKLNVYGFFDALAGREDGVVRIKQISKVLEEIKIPAENVLVIGDAVTDVVAASKISGIPVAVSKKPYEIQRFFELGVPCFSSVNSVLKTVIKVKNW